jgi:hypothetical protein
VIAGLGVGMLWLGIGLLVTVLFIVGLWRIRRSRGVELGSVSEQWIGELRRH